MIEGWITRDAKSLLQPLQRVAFSGSSPQESLPTIEVDDSQTFQPIEGFGFALTGGSAYLLAGLAKAERADLLRELFGLTAESVGLSCLRVSIGASDLGRKDFSYWGLRRGTKNPDIARFNLSAGDREVVPVLQEILEINPTVKIIASPWSAPPWMKNNGSYVGGRLKPEFYAEYARYFVRYVDTMRRHGIHVSAVTPQNEPHNPRNEPSMEMSATEQADFIKGHLGPALRKDAPETEILCWDHNCDEPGFPLTVLADAEARAYTAGVAWHLYNGSPEAMSKVRALYPDKKVYFTEQWISAQDDFMGALRWHTKNVIIGTLRNWSRVALEWNLASDPRYALHTRLGAVGALGGVTIGATIKPRHGAAGVSGVAIRATIKRNPGYYLMAHSARFIRPGSVRVYSSEVDQLPNVTCLTPGSRLVMVVMNDAAGARRFHIRHRGASATLELAPGDVATFRWNAATAAVQSETRSTPERSDLFPNGFRWGTATSAYQVEGAAREDGRGPSIWDTFAALPGRIRDGATGERGVEHYRRYREDVALMKSLGATSYRFSIAWPRLFPDGRGSLNQKGLAFYDRLVDELLSQGIEPFATLYHWDLPQALQDEGGWEKRDTALAFADYAGTVAERLGDRIGHFFTLNEMQTFIELGYGHGIFAPGLKLAPRQLAQARHHAVLAHGLAVQAVRSRARRGVRVGPAENIVVAVPAVETPDNIRAAELAFRELNAAYLTVMLEGRYSDAYLSRLGADAPHFTKEELEAIASPVDFVGLNVYTPGAWVVASEGPGYRVLKEPPSFPHMSAPWLKLAPEALYWAPRNVAKVWNVRDIYVTENGTSAADQPEDDGQVYDVDRIMYLRNCLTQLRRATAEGVPVTGYFLWSLLDNFEWAEGYATRFGLVHVDFATQKRTPKLSAQFYREVIARNALA